MTTGHGEPIQKQFAFEDQEHIVGVICHDPRCLPDPSKHPQTGPRLVQQLLADELEPARSDADGNGHVSTNGDGAGPAVPPPPYGIVLTAGGKVLRFALAPLAAVSTRKGRIVVRLDPTFKDDRVVGVQATDGSENVCLATRSARVLIFPVTEANIVAGAARGVVAIRLEPKDSVIGFVLANKKREGLTVRTNRGATQIVRATKYPVTARGGKGYAILQRGSLEAILPEEAEPIPSPEQIGESAGESRARADDET
jgi:DNA gyrase subunit A